MNKHWNVYILVHENDDKGPVCIYPKDDGVANVQFFWSEVGSGRKPPPPSKSVKFPSKWIRVKNAESFRSLFV